MSKLLHCGWVRASLMIFSVAVSQAEASKQASSWASAFQPIGSKVNKITTP